MLQIYFAKGHSKKMWGIVSVSLQKAQLRSPNQFLLSKLSFVRIALWFISQIHILIFKDILAFQISLKYKRTSLEQRWEYMDFTEKDPDFSHFQIGKSSSSLSAQENRISLSDLHCYCSLVSNQRLKVNLQLRWAIFAIVMFCSLQISKRVGNCSFKGVEPHQTSCQQSTLPHLPIFIFLPLR